MFKKLFCRHTFDLYIDNDDNPSKSKPVAFGLAQVKVEGRKVIMRTHARCRACGKVIHFVSVKFNP